MRTLDCRLKSQRSARILTALVLTAFTTQSMPGATPRKIGAVTNSPGASGTWALDQNGNNAWDGTVIDGFYFWGTNTPGEVFVRGDWNGDGTTKIGVYINGTWLLDYDGNGKWEEGVDKRIVFGNSTLSPVVGDWNGDGKTKIGVYGADGTFLLDYNGNGIWEGPSVDKSITWTAGPNNGEMAVIGDWNGDGKAKIGIYLSTGQFAGTWILDYNGNYAWNGPVDDRVLTWTTYSGSGELPVVGDWNGDGRTKIGVYHDGTWIVDYNGNYAWDGTSVDKLTFFGGSAWTPMVGDWNGNGIMKIAAYTGGTWAIDMDGDYFWNQPPDVLTNFGGSDYAPIVGAWPVITPSDFLVTNPADVTLITGQSATATFTMSAVSGFTFPSSFEYSLTSVPSATGLTASIAAGSPTITINSTTSNPGGTFLIGFSAVGNSITHTGVVKVTLVTPLTAICAVSPNPIRSRQVNTPAQNAIYTVYASGGTPYQGGGYQYVWGGTFAAQGGPSQTLTNNYYLTTTPISLNETVRVLDALSQSVYPVCPPLVVTPLQDISIALSLPPPPPIPAGRSANVNVSVPITISSLNGFSGQVSLSANTASWPAGVSGSLSSSTISTSGTIYLNLTITPAALAGFNTITITASASGNSYTASFPLQVLASTDPTFVIFPSSRSVSPEYAAPAANNDSSFLAATYSLFITKPSSSPLSIAVAGLPSGANYEFLSALPTGTGGKVDIKITVLQSTPIQTFPLTITATVGGMSLPVTGLLAVEPRALMTFRVCLKSGGPSCQLAAGDHNIANTLAVNRSNFTFQGFGTDLHQTKLMRDPSFTEPIIAIDTDFATPLTGITLQNFTVCGGSILDPSVPFTPNSDPLRHVDAGANPNSGLGKICPRIYTKCGDRTLNFKIEGNQQCTDVVVGNVDTGLYPVNPFANTGPYSLTINRVDFEDATGHALSLYANAASRKKVNDVYIHDSIFNYSGITGLLYGSNFTNYDYKFCDTYQQNYFKAFMDDPALYAPRNIRVEQNQFTNNNTGAMGGGAVRWFGLRNQNIFTNNYINAQVDNPAGGSVEMNQCADKVEISGNTFTGPGAITLQETDALELYSRNITVGGNNSISDKNTITNYPVEGIAALSLFNGVIKNNDIHGNDLKPNRLTGGIEIGTSFPTGGCSAMPRDTQTVDISQNSIIGQAYGVHFVDQRQLGRNTLSGVTIHTTPNDPNSNVLTGWAENNTGEIARDIPRVRVNFPAPATTTTVDRGIEAVPRLVGIETFNYARCSTPPPHQGDVETFKIFASDDIGAGYITAIEGMFSLSGKDEDGTNGPDNGYQGCHFLFDAVTRRLSLDQPQTPDSPSGIWTTSFTVGFGGPGQEITNGYCSIRQQPPYTQVESEPNILDLTLYITFSASASSSKYKHIYLKTTNSQGLVSNGGAWSYWGWWATP